MKIKISLFAVLISSFTVACLEEEEINPLLGEAEIYPLSIGKSYTQRTVAYDQNGQKIVDRMKSWTVERDTLIDGEIWYGFSDNDNFARNKSNGFHTYITVGKKESLVYKYPVEKGDTYESLAYIYDVEADDSNKEIQGFRKVQVLSSNATVTSPISGKVFEHCIHYRVANFTPTSSPSVRIRPNEQYVIPGIGQVLDITYYEEDLKKISSVNELQL